jgi:alkanesulfonate monooxygenase
MRLQATPIHAEGLDAIEVGWFAPLCSDDFRHPGVPEDRVRSSYASKRDIVLRAAALGLGNILCRCRTRSGRTR